MSQTPLRTAILGLNEQGRLLLECAAKGQMFKIEAVADKDAELAQRIAAEYNCRHYDDYRVAVMLTGIDNVFAAAPLHTCAEYICAALSKRLHVLRVAPPARTCDELAEFVQLASESGVNFAVASALRFNKAFTTMRKYLEESKIDNVSLVTARCGWEQSQEPWQRDPKLAGGGVLLYNCYEMIDQIVQGFGMPDEVYAVHTSQAPDRQQRLSVTEDTAVISMKFADTRTINIIAGRMIKPHESILNAYNTDVHISIDADSLSIFDSAGNLQERIKEPASLSELTSRLLSNFAQSIIAPSEIRPASNGEDHLKAMALIQSAYLSARTGTPESPQRILQMSQNNMARCLFK
jgi:predicted dehydrogenase